MRDETYEKVIEALAKTYGPRALALLKRIGEVCEEAGFVVEPEPGDLSADDYRWALSVCRPGAHSPVPEPPNHWDKDAIDISVEIAEASEYGDEDHDGYGLNFALDIVEYGGRILGGLTPYNYTDECWVDARDSEAVEARWKLLEDTCLDEIPYLIEN